MSSGDVFVDSLIQGNMQKKFRRLLTVAACATLLGSSVDCAHADDTAASPSIYGTLIKVTGTKYANGTDASTGSSYDVLETAPYWYSGGTNSLYIPNVGGGSLIVHDYTSSSITNGLLVALGGSVTADTGTLTIAGNSMIRRDTALTVEQDAILAITGGEVTMSTGDTLNGDITLSNGLLELDNFSRNSSTTSSITQTGGTMTITGTGMDFASDRDSITGGTVNVGQNATSGSLNVTHGYVASGATVNIFENSEMNVKGGNVTLDAGDTYRGDVTISSGELKLNSAVKTYNATFTQSGGDVLVTGDGFDLNNSTDKISGGDLYIGDGATTGNLAVTEGTIDSGATVNIGSGSNLNMKGGTVTLDSKDIYNGGINVSNGTVNLNDVEKSMDATFVQNGGTTNITGNSFVMNNSSDAINNGTLNVGGDSGSGTLTIRSGSVAKEADVNIGSSSTVDVKGGSLSLDSTDTWTGKVNVQNGTVNINNTAKTGTLTQSGGSINVTGNTFDLGNANDNLDGGTLTIGDGSTASTLNVSAGTITRNEDVTISTNSNLNISGGKATLDSTDNWNGNVKISSGELSLEEATKSANGIFTQTGGKTTVTGRTFDLNNDLDYVEGGDFTVGNGTSSSLLTISDGAIASGAKVNLTKNATIDVTGGDLVLDSSDTWTGNVSISDGTVKLNGATKNQEGTFTQTGGTTTISGTGLDFNNSEDTVSGGLLQIGNGTTTNLKLSQGTIQEGAEVNINKNASVDVAGGNLYLNNGDTWYGDVNVTQGGYLSVNGADKNGLGTLVQTGGNVDITSSRFELNNAGDNISGGTLTVGTSSGSTTLDVSEGKIGEKATVKLTSNSNIMVTGNGSVTLDASDTWNGGVEVNGGSLALIGINSKSGVLSQYKGTTTVTGTGLNLDNSDDNISGGTLNIGDGGTLSDITVSKGKITEDATVNLTNNSTMTVTSSGTVELGKTSTVNGNIDVQGGTFSVDSVAKSASGKYTQSGGTATIKGTGFDMNNAGDSVSGGTFNIGDGTQASEVKISKGVIQSSAVTNVNSNAKLNIAGGTVSLGSDDTYNGEIDISDGILDLKSVTKGEDGVLNQTGGTTTITGTSFGLDNPYDSVTGGTLNIGNGTVATTTSVSGGTITSGATTNINKNATMSISGTGNVALDKWDTVDGNITMTNGTLSLDNVTKNTQSVFTQTGGNTTVTGTGFDLSNYQDNISGGSLAIGDGSTVTDFGISEGTVASDVRIDLKDNASINVNGGTLAFDNKDKWNGDINMKGGTLTLDNIEEKNGTFTQTKGTTTVTGTGLDLNQTDDNVSGGTFNIGDGKTKTDLTVSKGTIGADAALNLNEASKLKITGGNVTFNDEDTINGDIKISAGSLTLDDISKNADNTLIETGGVVTVTGDKFDLNNEDDNISHGYFIVGDGTNKAEVTVSKGNIGKDATTILQNNSTMNISGGSVSLDKATDTVNGDINMSAGTLELDSISKSEGSTFTQTGGDTTVTGTGFSLNNANDKVSGGTMHVGGTTAGSSLGIDGGTISDTAVVTVDNGSSVDMTTGTITSGATVNFKDTSKFNMDEGTISDKATINLNDSTAMTMKKGTITNNATVNVTNSGTMYIAQGIISDGATVNADKEAIITMANGAIKSDANLNLSDTSTFNMQNGNITKTANVTLDDRAVMNMTDGMVDEGANLNLNSQSTLNLNGGEIAEDANVSLTEHATINQTGGTMSLNSTDTYAGTVNMQGGSLALVGITKASTGVLNQTGGNTKVTGTTFDLNNTKDNISGGTLQIGDKNDITTMTVSNGTISEDADVAIYKNSTLKVAGGKVTLDSGDTLNGNIDMSLGDLTLDNASKSQFAEFTQTGGETFIDGTGFDLNNENDNISGGKTVIGMNTTSSDLTLSEGKISSDANVRVKNNSSLNVSGGSITEGATVNVEDSSGLNLTDGEISNKATVNFEDTSKMTMSGGEVTDSAVLNFEDTAAFTMNNGTIKDNAAVNITEDSTFTMNKGKLTSNAELNVSNEGKFNMKGGIISDDAKVNLEHEAVMTMDDGVVKSGAVVTLDDTSVLNMNDGNITKSATVNVNDRAQFNMSEGTFNDGATLNLDDQGRFNISGGTFDEDATMVVSEQAVVNQSGGTVRLDKTDTLGGDYNLTGGDLELDKVTKKENAEFHQTGGNTIVTGDTFDLNNSADNINGGTLQIGTADDPSVLNITKGTVGTYTDTTIVKDSTINVKGGKLTLDSNDTWNGDVNMTKGSVAFNSVTKDKFAKYTQTDGVATITGKGFTFNNEEDSITGGTVYVGGEVADSEFNIAEGKIAEKAIVKVSNNSAINMNGGQITDGATVAFKDTSSFNMTDGEVSDSANMIFNDSSKMNMTDGDITNSAVLEFKDSAQMKMTDGTISDSAELNFKDDTAFTMTSGEITDNAKVNFEDNAKFDMTDGEINNGATITLKDQSDFQMNSSVISDKAVVNMHNESTMSVNDGKIATGATVNMDDYSKLNIDGGAVTDEAVVNLNDRSELTLTDGTISDAATINLNDASAMNVEEDGIINSTAVINIGNRATVNQNGGKMTLNSGDTYNGRVNMKGGELVIKDIAKADSAVFNQTGGDTTILDTTFDLNNAEDRVSGGSLTVGTVADPATLTVSRGIIDREAVTKVAKGSKLDITGGSVVLDGETDDLIGSLSISNGTLELDDMTKHAESTFTQTGGTTLVKGQSFTMNNDDDVISGGVVNIGGDTADSKLTIAKGSITGSETKVYIDNGSTLDVNGGTVTNGATVTAYDTSSVDVTGGTINDEAKIYLKDKSTLDVSDGEVELSAYINLGDDATLNQTGGKVALSGEDVTDGSINLYDGDLSLTGITKTTTDTATYNQTGGTANLDNTKLVLATEASKITDGTVNLTNGSTLDVNNSSDNESDLNVTNSNLTLRSGSKYTTTGGEIDKASAVKVENNATLYINSDEATVRLDGSNDNVEGNLIIADGKLYMTDGFDKITTSDGKYVQSGGDVSLDNSRLSLATPESSITGGTMSVTNGGTLEINNSSANRSDLTVTGSNLKLRNGSKYTLTGGEGIDKASAVTVEKNATLELSNDETTIRLDGNNDDIAGNLIINDGTLYISDDLTKVTTADGNYIQNGGDVTLDDSRLTLETTGSKIASGTMSLTNGSALTVLDPSSGVTGGALSIDDTSKLYYLSTAGMEQTTDKISLNTSGYVDLMNGKITNNTIDNLTVNNGTDGDGTADFAIDINARANGNASTDKFTANTITVSTKNTTGVINVSDFNLMGDVNSSAPISKHIRLGKIFDSDKIDEEIKFTSTDKEVSTPIGTYKLNASSENDGNYTLDLTSYNPQVFRGQVVTAASYLNQLSVNDSLFNKAQIRRYSPSYADMFRNRTAMIEGVANYDRTMRESEVWTEAIGNFETFKFNHDLDKVRNNYWGFIVGSDFGVKHLRRGWTWVPTGYIAYTGGHQTFNKVGAYENGAQIGFMSTWRRSNFIETALINTGIYGVDMDVANSSEHAFGYFAGLASKTAYDIQITHNFRIQPALTLSYNMFGKQNYHSDYGNMHMNSGFLNGFNIAPNLNFIFQKESWSAYAQISYAWNLFGGLNGKAGDVKLSDIRMSDGYVQYAVGLTKAFSDRLDMYAQATFRNLGRTGVVCQGGLNWRL